MPWLTLGGMALSTTLNANAAYDKAVISQGTAEIEAVNFDSQQYTQRTGQQNQYIQTLLQSSQEAKGIQKALRTQSTRNQAVAKADVQSLINTHYMAGLARIQLGQQRRAAASRTQNLGATRIQALGAAVNSSAASGTIGASTKAVSSDIENKIGNAAIRVQEDLSVQTFNYGTQINNMYRNYLQNRPELDLSTPDLSSSPDAPEFAPWASKYVPSAPSYGSMFMQAAGGQVMDYATKYLTLGSGSSTSAPGFAGGTTIDSLQAGFALTKLGSSGFGSGLAYGNADLGSAL